MSRMFASARQSSNNEQSVLQGLLEKKQSELAELYNQFRPEPSHSNQVPIARFEEFLRENGLDPLREDLRDQLNELDSDGDGWVSIADFSKVLSGNSTLRRALTRTLAVENFAEFCEDLVKIFHDTSHISEGHLPDYIPALLEVDPDAYSFSICTVDGQQFSYGDTDSEFCLEAVIQPLLYCLAIEDVGKAEIDEHIGREPSGSPFNAFTLNKAKKPHNPMINTGGIVLCSLIRPASSPADRFSFVQNGLRELSGDAKVTFNQPVYLSEREHADRNFALAYYMRHAGIQCLEGPMLNQAADFFFQCCSTQCDASALATMASTLANGGVCPATGKRVLHPQTVKHCLALLYSTGMYDYSGEWSFTVGVPAKSGVSGVLMVIIPNKMGLVVYSPRVDEQGNSVRGIEFCRRVTKQFHFSIMDQLVGL